MKRFHRVYAKIHLDYIEENIRAMQKNLLPGTSMMGIVKADGYGHGAVPVAKTIDPYVSSFGVATLEEGLQLRHYGITKSILVLGVVPPRQYEEMVAADICPTMFQIDRVRQLSELAYSMNKIVRIHIGVDTGMSRIGLMPTEESADLVKEMSEFPGIEIEGVFTHFARSDEENKLSTMKQIRKFQKFREMLEKRGICNVLYHCSNSAAIMDMPEANMDMVRAGITMYGLYPSDEVKKERLPLKPVMELKSFLTYVKDVPLGTEVSYGGIFKTDKPMRIGTVCIGYGDGYPRKLSGRGYVLVCGKKVPILGRICMDQCMVDVTNIPEAKEGCEVTLLGFDGQEEISVEELADNCDGFHYEIPCVVGKRVPRIYVSNGKLVGTLTCEYGTYEGF